MYAVHTGRYVCIKGEEGMYRRGGPEGIALVSFLLCLKGSRLTSLPSPISLVVVFPSISQHDTSFPIYHEVNHVTFNHGRFETIDMR